MMAIGSGSACRAAALATVLMVLAPGGSAQAHTVEDCSVNGIEGAPVRVQVDGRWSALEPGPLPAGTQKIATGPGARAEIVCNADLVVTIGAATEVSLDAFLAAHEPSEPVLIRLLRGILGIDAPQPAWAGFEVHTPLAIASARSTVWLVESGEVTGAAAFVRSGSVEVTSLQRQLLAVLEAGEGVTMVPGPDGSLPDPDSIAVIEWGPARIEAAATSLGFGWR